VRVANLSTAFYAPAPVPNDPNDLTRFIASELGKLQAAIAALSAGHLDMVYVAPTKPREGDLRLADGTQWNPGSGVGVYCYYGSAWHYLG
jgi:hypothetical protein